MTGKSDKPFGSGAFFVRVRQLGRHLPVLAVVVGLPLLSAATLTVANHAVNELLFRSGDATVLLKDEIKALTIAWAKVAALAEQAMTALAGS